MSPVVVMRMVGMRVYGKGANGTDNYVANSHIMRRAVVVPTMMMMMIIVSPDTHFTLSKWEETTAG